jgi:hypothetical protein
MSREKHMSLMTVALPLYRAELIAWLALESLCRQDGAPVPWELVVAEERGEHSFGNERLAAYRHRLEAAGCARVTYLPLEQWIPLSRKWRMLAEASSEQSKVFVLQAADCYSPPKRLLRTWEISEAAAGIQRRSVAPDWVQSHTHVLHDLTSGRTVVYRNDAMLCGADMACRTEIVRDLPDSHVEVGVDTWMIKQADFWCGAHMARPLRVGWNETDDWRYGVNVSGLNNISDRSRLFDLDWGGVSLDAEPLETYMPGEIVQRLRQCAPLSDGWRRRAWRSA